MLKAKARLNRSSDSSALAHWFKGEQDSDAIPQHTSPNAVANVHATPHQIAPNAGATMRATPQQTAAGLVGADSSPARGPSVHRDRSPQQLLEELLEIGCDYFPPNK